MRLLKSIGLFGLLLTGISCTDKAKTDTSENQQPTTADKDQIVFEDSFAAEPLQIGQDFRDKFSDFEIKAEPIKNKYTAGQVDTIFTLTKNGDALVIYKLPSTQFITDMTINSDRIVLSKNIRLGTSKTDFYKKFGQLDTVRLKKDHVHIWETQSNIDFIFTADKLSKIVWDGGEID